ncbi:MAG: hypothetical protein A2W09_04890 [Deltaproteobacteria bacterium RBG_16_50_11]|nr:MAG: hypothetical protein A2W09_04890 [Deltaproteobacteria bacterium RBG_16_50_11]
MISGESGGTDSPEGPLAFGRKSNLWDRALFVCRYFPTDKKILSLRSLWLCGEYKHFFAAFNKLTSMIMKIAPIFNLNLSHPIPSAELLGLSSGQRFTMKPSCQRHCSVIGKKGNKFK